MKRAESSKRPASLEAKIIELRTSSISVRLPSPIFGYFLSVVLFTVEIRDVVQETVSLTPTLLVIGALLLWLGAVFQLHQAIQEATLGLHPIKSWQAALFQLIPFFNLYWFFRWPLAIGETVEWTSDTKIASGGFIGIFVLFGFGMLGHEFAEIIGVFLLTSVYAYYRRKLRIAFGFENV